MLCAVHDVRVSEKSCNRALASSLPRVKKSLKTTSPFLLRICKSSEKLVAYMDLALDKGGDIFLIIKDGQSLQ